MVTLDLCSTLITDEPLISILKANAGLKHLLLGKGVLVICLTLTVGYRFL